MGMASDAGLPVRKVHAALSFDVLVIDLAQGGKPHLAPGIAAAAIEHDARRAIEGKLNSSHDELSGSIAKNHEELVALQKRGERNYYEFEIDKSKQFQKVGPLSVSLRKVNQKHGYYDVALMFDDRQLEKKHVNLYEPMMLSTADRPQPIELVVNQIHDNFVKGYISEPKYKKDELALTRTSDEKPKVLQQR